MLTATPTRANQASQQIASERKTATWWGIFLNNVHASWILVVPAFGLVLFSVVWYNTAIYFGLASAAYNANATIVVLFAFLLTFPEISAYIFALAENIYVTYLAVNGLGAGARIRTQSWKTWIVWLSLLLIGAVTEWMLIKANL
jgi:hypothetical protein